jgi:hypothetical protein
MPIEDVFVTCLDLFAPTFREHEQDKSSRSLVSAYSIKTNPIFSGVLARGLPFDSDGFAQMESELARCPAGDNRQSVLGGVIGRDIIGNPAEAIVISLPTGPRQENNAYVITSFSLDWRKRIFVS